MVYRIQHETYFNSYRRGLEKVLEKSTTTPRIECER
jgi:hypothetical protein